MLVHLISTPSYTSIVSENPTKIPKEATYISRKHNRLVLRTPIPKLLSVRKHLRHLDPKSPGRKPILVLHRTILKRSRNPRDLAPERNVLGPCHEVGEGEDILAGGDLRDGVHELAGVGGDDEGDAEEHGAIWTLGIVSITAYGIETSVCKLGG